MKSQLARSHRMPVLCCWLQLVLMLCSASQDLMVNYNGNSSRIAGFGAFSRTCQYTGAESDVQLNWLLNGTPVKTTDSRTINLLIDLPQSSDAGEYSCAVFSDGNTQNKSAGALIFYSVDSIHAPATQQVLAGEDIMLQCSSGLPGTEITWRDPSDRTLNSATLEQVNLGHQGRYACRILDTFGASTVYTVIIQLEVIVSPTLLSLPSVKEMYANEYEIFTVNFLSSFKSDTTITWLINNNLLQPNQIISTQFQETNLTVGNTSLEFLQLNRSDNGRYTIVLHNNRTLIPIQRRNVNTSFTVNVYVPPTPPTAPNFEIFNSTLSRITWRLTNHTTDAGPESLIVNIDNDPISPVHLLPGVKELLLRTEPGRRYTVTVTSTNVDGMATSQPAHLNITPEAPLLVSHSAIRLNRTAFNFSLEVEYTGAGGGGLKLTDIMFRERGTSDISWIMNGFSIDLISSSKGTWYALVINDQFAMINEVEFSFVAQNVLMNHTEQRTALQVVVVPGAPDNITLVSSTPTSLTLQAHLSTIGTAPLVSVHFMLTRPDRTSFTYNLTKNLLLGDQVEIEVGDLSPDTSYMVLVYATNEAGRGQDSMEKSFITASAASVLPLWIILIIAIVGSLIVVILLILLLISCCCRRHNDRKINIAATVQSYQDERPPAGSIESIPASSNYNYSQKSFILGPPPLGLVNANSPVNIEQTSYKPRFQNSTSESESSEQSSKYNHFNFHHSPIPPSIIQYERVEYSRSMPVLDDPDISPTMPPNCATDV